VQPLLAHVTLIKQAESGNAIAQYQLGVSYASNDLTTAFVWYRKSAEQGYALAQYNLGYAYDFGVGVPKNEAEAIRWYRKAAEQGISDAQSRLAAKQVRDRMMQEALAHINQHFRSSHEFNEWLISQKLSVSADSASGDKLILSYDIKHQSTDKTWKTIHHRAEVLVADLDINSLDSIEHKINSQAHIKCKENASCVTDNGEKSRDFYLFCKSGYAEESAAYLERILLITQGKAAPEIKHYPNEKEILAYLQSNIAPSLLLSGGITGFNRRFLLEGDDLVMTLDLRNDSPRTGHLVMRMKLSQLIDTVGASGSSIELLCNVTRVGQLNNCITDNSGDAFPHIEIKEVFNSHEVAQLLKRLILLHEVAPALPKALLSQPPGDSPVMVQQAKAPREADTQARSVGARPSFLGFLGGQSRATVEANAQAQGFDSLNCERGDGKEECSSSKGLGDDNIVLQFTFVYGKMGKLIAAFSHSKYQSMLAALTEHNNGSVFHQEYSTVTGGTNTTWSDKEKNKYVILWEHVQGSGSNSCAVLLGSLKLIP
jgi:hypothetical protein